MKVTDKTKSGATLKADRSTYDNKPNQASESSESLYLAMIYSSHSPRHSYIVIIVRSLLLLRDEKTIIASIAQQQVQIWRESSNI